MEQILENVSRAVWGIPLITAILVLGIYLTVRLHFIQIRSLPHALRLLLRAPKSGHGAISSFGALATSLAAMIGTGNIVGVATAVSIGGPGAIFWMIIAAFFGMAISYAEGMLAVKYRTVARDGHVLGGAFSYIEHGLGIKPLAKAFAICGAMAALVGIGTMTQVNGISAAFCDLFDLGAVNIGTHSIEIGALAVSIVVTALAAVVIFGGIDRISRVSTVVVPVMGLIYVLGTLGVLVLYADQIPDAISVIVKNALSGDAALGGATGLAVRMGVSRGIFSNEAGLGSASIASAAAKTESPHEQGLCTMTGTFIDTIVLCTMTGLAIVITGAYQSELSGVELTNFAYNRGLYPMPGMGKLIVSTSLMLFAFASILGWNYYGEQCVEYLTGQRRHSGYRIAYLTAVFLGAILKVDVVWNIADILNGLMAAPNLIALYALSGIVISEKSKEKKRERGLKCRISK